MNDNSATAPLACRMDPVVSQPARDSHGSRGVDNLSSASGNGGDGDARPAALKEEGEVKQRFVTSSQGVQTGRERDVIKRGQAYHCLYH